MNHPLFSQGNYVFNKEKAVNIKNELQEGLDELLSIENVGQKIKNKSNALKSNIYSFMENEANKINSLNLNQL